MADNIPWMDKLFEEIDEMFADSKQIKFNAHKNRKAFVNTLKANIKQAVEANTNPKATGRMAPTITRPNPNKSTGFAVMTESESSKNDGILPDRALQQRPYDPEAIAKNNRGMRSW